MTPLDLAAVRCQIAESIPWRDGVLTVEQAEALVAEVERLRAVEADAERARVKADLWSYYEAFVSANGAEGITQLVVQRDEARAEVERLREHQELCTANLLKGYETGKAEERAAVVAWLHRMERNARRWGGKDDERADIYARLADVFDCGEHREENE